MQRLGKAMGANEKTFMGLSGVGDLLLLAQVCIRETDVPEYCWVKARV